MDSVRKVLLTSCLAATLVSSGALPEFVQLESPSALRNCPTATPQRGPPGVTAYVRGRSGVAAASAASFNDEQRAIAETWVGSVLWCSI